MGSNLRTIVPYLGLDPVKLQKELLATRTVEREVSRYANKRCMAAKRWTGKISGKDTRGKPHSNDCHQVSRPIVDQYRER